MPIRKLSLKQTCRILGLIGAATLSTSICAAVAAIQQGNSAILVITTALLSAVGGLCLGTAWVLWAAQQEDLVDE